MGLEIVEVKEGTVHERMFLDHIGQDTFEYFFFLLDWHHERKNARFYMALDGSSIEGLLIIYKERVAQLRGGREAVRRLLELVDMERAELLVPLEHKELLLEIWDAPVKDVIIGMTMGRGEERYVVTTRPERLGPDDAEDIARIMREASRVLWEEVTGERIKESMADITYIGIRQEGKVVAIGSARALEFGGHIFAMATEEAFRGRGFATSIAATFAAWLLERCDRAGIFVKEENPPAVRAYTKAGFRPYRKYYFMKFAERKD